jgi:hypothetical protein
MKRKNAFLTLGFVLMSMLIVFSSCKKKSTDTTPSYPSPAFIVTYVPVTITNPNDGVQFFANCSTTDVKMTKVEILDPIHSGTVTYNLNATTYVKGQIFGLQDAGTGYYKQGGTYTFTFTCNRSADNAPFTIVSTLNVAK